MIINKHEKNALEKNLNNFLYLRLRYGFSVDIRPVVKDLWRLVVVVVVVCPRQGEISKVLIRPRIHYHHSK